MQCDAKGRLNPIVEIHFRLMSKSLKTFSLNFLSGEERRVRMRGRGREEGERKERMRGVMEREKGKGGNECKG